MSRTTPPPLSQTQQVQQPGGTKIVIIAVFLGLVAVAVVQVYISIITSRTREDTFDVYVLSRSYAPGDQFDTQDVERTRVPNDFRDNLKHLNIVIGEELDNVRENVVKRPSPAGAILSRDMFMETTEFRLAMDLTTGHQMVTVPVRSEDAPGPLLPGSVVDIHGTFLDGRTTRTLTVLDKVKVLAVGTYYRTGEGDGSDRAAVRGYRSITIELPAADITPFKDVQRVAMQMQDPPFHVTIRKPDDRSDAYKHGTATGRMNPKVVEIVENILNMEPGSLYGRPS